MIELATRGQRITMWLTSGICIGAWKADNLLAEGVAEEPAYRLGATYTVCALMAVGFGYKFATTGFRVWQRLFRKRRHG